MMNNKELKTLIAILSLQAESYKKEQQEFLAEEALAFVDDCENLIVESDSHGNYYITKGQAEIYPCAVAHLDQVHDFHKDYKIHQHDDVLFAFNGYKQVGVGGDDKCGVFLCVEMLNKFDNVKVAFFQDEEVGCIGSGKCDMTFFEDCAFVLQGDRNHYFNDFITTTNGLIVCSDEFKKEAENYYSKYEYGLATGSITDVGELSSRGIGCSTVNIACGYTDAHTDREVVSISKLTLCLRLFEDIFENMSHKIWKHTPTNAYQEYYGRLDYGTSSYNDRGKYFRSADNDYNRDYYEDFFTEDDFRQDNYVLEIGESEEDVKCPNCNIEELKIIEGYEHCECCLRSVEISTGYVYYKGDKPEHLELLQLENGYF